MIPRVRQYVLKSVFSEIRVRTWVQMVSRQKIGHWLADLSGLPIRALFFKAGNHLNWIHVLNQISEQTDFRNIWSFPRNIFYINLQCTVSLQWSSIAAWVNSVFSARQVKVFPWSEGLGTKCKRDLVILPPSKIWKYWGKNYLNI